MTKEWNREKKIAALVLLPWTVIVARDDTDEYFVARVAELSDVIATGKNDRELARDLWESLETSFDARLDFDVELPLPRNSIAPWMQPEGKIRLVNATMQVGGDAWNQPLPVSSATSEILAVG